VNREIKFRAKRIDMDRWIYGQYFTTPLTDENSGTKPDAGWFFLTGELRHCIVQNGVSFVIDLKTLGQYTGMKSNSGKEIYEGDIISGQYNAGTVIFKHGSYQIQWDINPYDCSYLLTYADEQEAIGNVYDNPELAVMES
jgi:uncharacterized phage protein (TIGR01671 family)